ncbi:MAG: hypothetical protein ACI8QZ_003201 [Chlamydiales bacterium]|jgi:hypothetical protein
MRVLNSHAHLQEDPQPLIDAQPVLVAVLGDRHALDQIHHEVRSTGFGRARIQHARDVWMFHQRKGLALLFKPRNDLR